MSKIVRSVTEKQGNMVIRWGVKMSGEWEIMTISFLDHIDDMEQEDMVHVGNKAFNETDNKVNTY